MFPPVVDLTITHRPRGASDRVAFGFVKALRFCADTFFAKRYGHRAVVLETVAAAPGIAAPTVIPATWPHSPQDPHWRGVA